MGESRRLIEAAARAVAVYGSTHDCVDLEGAMRSLRRVLETTPGGADTLRAELSDISPAALSPAFHPLRLVGGDGVIAPV